MRVTFGQNSPQFYEYGSQKTRNTSYKQPEKNDTLKHIGLAIFGTGCVGLAFLQKQKKH